eukprot:CAMPEP_0185034340 /NCGR_PEP_ID=MMETSP1103-20130426/24109_1 /TAXON_ID=36769 /ORGANISM="Paraphysomonas bandaiensis, Strain Caron Lab Isolate" /LENGTH=1005 /DNA_ID=CAMNT_0027570957 /DNA_START=192 /DNA_END=3209 /DNA_ORIENTATION=-
MVSKAPHRHLLIIDTNVAIHQIDVLEYNCPATSLVVVLQTVLQELRHSNLSVYRRMCALLQDNSRSYIFFPNEQSSHCYLSRECGESVNDYNDRLIRKGAQFYGKVVAQHDGELCTAILLTNDRDNMRLAKADNLHCVSTRSYVEQYLQQYPELLDLLAEEESSGGADGVQRENLFSAHLPMDALLRGIRNKQYYRGVLRCFGSSSSECYVVVHSSTGKHGSEDSERKSVTVRGSQCVNRALDGDVVAVEIIADPSACPTPSNSSSSATSESPVVVVSDVTANPSADAVEGLASSTGAAESNPSKTFGRVVGIIRRNWRQYAGSVSASSVVGEGVAAADDLASPVTAMFNPVDSKIPRVKISTRRIEELLGKRILVAIDYWPVWSEYPIGHYVRVMGNDGDSEVETQVLLHEFGVPYESFSTEVMACLPPKDWKITEDIIASRTDIRHIPVVSIDPPGCKDIDDALHCRNLPNGNFEVGVHIADVSYFVKPDTAIDIEAAHRSTSTYLVERRLDMLPSLLTTELCSLRSTEDHLAFSVIWEMDRSANIIDAKFFRSVIRSVASLTYDEAQAMLDSDTDVNAAATPADSNLEVVQSVKNLNHLAQLLRSKRIEEGALTLASPEVRFKFEGESDNPTDVSVYSIKDSNKLVEEFMLLANITVSKKVLRHFPTLGVLRRHQPPSKEQFAPLLSAAAAVGVHLDISTSKTLADSLDLAERPGDPFFNKLLRILSTRCMMPAQYFCSGELPKDQWHHYGLAAPVYTHFTSPIRRYADLVVHRLLSAAIGDTSLPIANADKTRQQELCSHMNRRHRSAQHIQRASTGLHTIRYFRGKQSVEEAYVLSIYPERVVVIVPRFGIEGTMNFLDIVNENYPGLLEGTNSDDLSLADVLSGIVQFDPVAHKATIQKDKVPLLCLQVFQKVHVRISVVENENDRKGRRVVMRLVVNDKGGGISGQSDTPNVTVGKKRRHSGTSEEGNAGQTVASVCEVQSRNGNSSKKKKQKLRKRK